MSPGHDSRSDGTSRPPPALEERLATARSRIVVAAASSELRAMARGALADRYLVETVEDGRAALDAASRQAPDLLLTARMPGHDGLDLVHELRSRAGTSNVPVLLLSGADEAEWRLEGLKAGADDWLVEPFTPHELRARVDVHLTKSRLRAEATRRERGAAVHPVGGRAALRPTEEPFRAIIRESRDGIIVVDGVGTIVEWNHGEEAITGVSSSEAVGRPIWEIQHRLAPDEKRDADFLGAARRRVLKGLNEGVGLERTLEDEIQRPDGTRRTIQSIVFAVRSDDELLACGICRDVTERRRLEEDLRESEERFRTMADSAPVMIWVTDAQGNNRFVNRAYCEFFGRTVEEVEGSGWQPLLHPDDAEAYVAAVQAALGARRSFDAQARVRHRSGEWRWLESCGTPRLSPSGEVLGMVGTSSDITARKRAERALERSEEDLSRAQAVAHVGSWKLEPSSGALEWSPETYRIFDIAPGTPIDEEKFLAAIHPDDRRYIESSWEGALHGEPYDIEHRVVTDRGIRWVREVGHVELAPDGSLVGGFGTVQDITDRKEMEQALADANRRKDEFLALLSHELRNPLAPIRSSLYVLGRARPGGEQARRMLTIIERQVSHLNRLVDDLLDVTRISRGKIQLRREHVDLVDVVRRTVEDHRSTFAAGDIRLEGPAAAAPMWLTADPTRIAQVVGNLLTNAAKFTPAGGRVDVTVERDGEHAVLRVRDTGVGITAETLGRMFEPFEQADRTLDRASGGLGLGLALVKGLAELHGGSAAAVSDGPGKGAELTVRLPLAAAGEARARPVAPRSGRPRRILIIEDGIDAAGALKEALEIDGHEVQVAYDGPEGLALAHELQPEVVLCDIGLPGMDGYEVARAFQADEALRGSYLVALTGYALPEDLQRAEEAGFRRHLPKPPTFDMLDEVLAAAPAAEAPTESPARAPTGAEN